MDIFSWHFLARVGRGVIASDAECQKESRRTPPQRGTTQVLLQKGGSRGSPMQRAANAQSATLGARASEAPCSTWRGGTSDSQEGAIVGGEIETLPDERPSLWQRRCRNLASTLGKTLLPWPSRLDQNALSHTGCPIQRVEEFDRARLLARRDECAVRWETPRLQGEFSLHVAMLHDRPLT